MIIILLQYATHFGNGNIDTVDEAISTLLQVLAYSQAILLTVYEA